MEIIDLKEENKSLYFCCLEDWSDEIKEAKDHKKHWYEKMKDKVRVKLAVDDNNQVGGMIQYLPIEHSIAQGSDLYMINCIWVHGHKKGRGNFQKKGMGTALLESVEHDVRNLGAKGIVAWGVSLPFWMRASWFKKHGYKAADRNGISILLWKPFTDDATPPKWIKQTKKVESVPNKVTITSFINGWCPTQNLVHERAKRAAQQFDDKVVFQEINTFDRDNLLEFGIVDGLFIDGKEIRTGPPPTFETLRKTIERKVKKIK